MLGPFSVALDGTPVKLAGPKQRAVLSLLALNANATVSLEQLVDGLWGEQPPVTAPKMIQQYVSQLRRLLDDGNGTRIRTQGRGYRLEVDADAVDALRFERLVSRGRAGEALELWDGAPLTDLLEEPFAPSEIRRLEELHLVAIELLIENELEAGRHSEIIPRLQALVEEHPLRERLRSLLMLALYRAGRQAEALDAFREARWTLVETLGLEPGPELRRLEEAILRQDPALERVVPDQLWANAQTVERLGEGAGRISQARGEILASERELAADVADLQILRRRVPADVHESCPFKGLEPFDVDDADVFFGRERLVAEMVARLPGTNLLGIVGPSGSGKSSVARAGLLPALASGVLPDSERWTRLVMRPGDRPLETLRRALREHGPDPLAGALGRLAKGTRLVLLVDQFEETFTACSDLHERQAFLDAVMAPVLRADESFLVLLALRADYYGACAQHPQLARELARNQVLVGPMRRKEIACAIEEPAARAGLQVEPELVARLVEEAADRPGALPLLSTALLELWERRSGSRMTLRAYEQTGGVEGAVARMAETAYEALPPGDARVARNILLRLAATGETDAAVRRRVPLAEFDLSRSEPARRVLDVLTSRRLLTVGHDAVEVAHEALLREWPRLREWLEEDAEARRLHRHVTLAAREWDAAGRDPAELYRGARLSAALDFAVAHEDELNALEREFLDASRMAGRQEAERARRVNRRLRTLLAAALGALAVAALGGVIALDQRSDARDAALAADAQRLGAQALSADVIDQGLLLARAGVALDASPVTRGNLLTTLLKHPPALLGVFPALTDSAIRATAVSPAGDLVAFGDETGAVRVFTLPGRRLVGSHRITFVAGVAFSPDGRTLAVAGHEPTESPTVIDLLDARTARRLRRIRPPRIRDSKFLVASLQFTPDGRELLVNQTATDTQHGSRLDRVDVHTGRATAGPVRFPVGSHDALHASADRRRAFVTSTYEDVTYEVDTEAMRVVRRHPAGGGVGALHPDGASVVIGTTRGELRQLELASGRVRAFAGGHRAAVSVIAYSPDGATVVSGHDDGTLVAWDARARTERERFEGHGERVESLVFTPDSAALVSAGTDGRSFFWDVSGEERVLRTFALDRFATHEPMAMRAVAASASGASVAVTNAGGSVDVLDARTLTPRGSLSTFSGAALAVGFSPDDSLLATAGFNGQVAVWDTGTLELRSRLRGLRGFTQALALSADGKLIAASDMDQIPSWVRMWNVGTGRQTGLKLDYEAASIAFSPDGSLLALAGPSAPAQIRAVRENRVVAELKADAPASVIAFAPDGRSAFVGLSNGAGQFFSTSDGRRLGASVRGQDQRLTSAAFTPDGRTLVTASADGTVLLWDVASRRAIGAPIVVAADTPVTAALSPDGRTLFAVSNGTRGIRLELSPAAWEQHACLVAGRELTRGEWDEVLPRRAYRRICD